MHASKKRKIYFKFFANKGLQPLVPIFITIFLILNTFTIFSQNISYDIKVYDYDFTPFIETINKEIIWQDKNSDNKIERDELVFEETSISDSDWSKINSWQKSQSVINSVKIFDSSSLKEKFSAPVTSVDFSSNGYFIAGGSESGELKIFNINTQKCIFDAHNMFKAGIISVKFNPEGDNLIAISKDNSIKIFDILDDKMPIYKEKFDERTEHIEHLCISADGQFIAIGTNIIRIYIKAYQNAWENIFTSDKKHNFEINDLIFTPDSKYAVAAVKDLNYSKRTAHFFKMFSIERGFLDNVDNIAYQYSSRITSIAASPDNKLLFTGSEAGQIRGYGKNWDKIIEKPVFDISSEFSSAITSISISNDSKYLAASTSKGDLKILDIDKQIQFLDLSRYFQSSIKKITFLPDKKHIAALSANNKIAIFKFPSGDPLFVLDDMGNEEKQAAAFSFTKDSKYVARGSSNNKIEIFKIQPFNFSSYMEVFVSNDAYNQLIAIFNKHFDGLKSGDKIYHYQKNISTKGTPIYHIRIRLRNGEFMLVRTTTDTETLLHLFDEMDYIDKKRLSVNIIIAGSIDELDRGLTEKGDWNSEAGKLLELAGKDVLRIKNR